MVDTVTKILAERIEIIIGTHNDRSGKLVDIIMCVCGGAIARVL